MHAPAQFSFIFTILEAEWQYPHLNDVEIEAWKMIDVPSVAVLVLETSSVNFANGLSQQ